DGYAATVITDAAVRSMESDSHVITVDMKPRPAFYGGTA
ncbi:inositol 2-dehydrogenase, partial [Streptomyces sp. 2MCAF27]